MVSKFYVDAKAHGMFKELIDEKRSPFFSKDFKDVFIFALSIGFIMNRKKELKRKKDIADIDVFNDNQLNLIKTIAIANEKNIKILLDEKKILTIAEEFANSGIYVIYELIMNSNNPIKEIDKKIASLIRKN